MLWTARSRPPSRKPGYDGRCARRLPRCKAGERGFEGVDGEGFCEDRSIAPAWSGLTNETAGRNEKWDRSRRKSLCHRIARRAGSEIDINDRRIELACRGMIERRRDIARGTGDTCPSAPSASSSIIATSGSSSTINIFFGISSLLSYEKHSPRCHERWTFALHAGYQHRRPHLRQCFGPNTSRTMLIDVNMRRRPE